MLRFLSAQSTLSLWMIFLAENLFVTLLALLFGWVVLKLHNKPIKPASPKEIFICIITNLINTGITFTGFWMWQHDYITFTYAWHWHIATDFILLFLLMDLAMFLFHYFIHHSVIYKTIHRFHHHYENPIPIDLFVLHPFETVGFGSLWLMTIALISFNIYAVFIYLAVNVFFGITGHLGIEPIPAAVRNWGPLKFLGTSTFHHNHHLDINHNFGFYTSIWDKLFKTFKQ